MATTWTLNFLSRTNVNCTLTIQTSSGSGSYTLTGASVPFVMDENASTSLLDVVRTRTGVIRLLETSYGELDGLRPTTNTSHKVTFYYGSSLQFVGYIQPSDYESDWIAAPRILEFPVASPVSLANSVKFDTSEWLGIQYGTTDLYWSMSDVLEQICDKLEIEYYTVPQSAFLSDKINYTNLVPFNPEFPSDRVNEDLYAPQSLLYAIEGICRAYGWMCYDEPNNLVFVPVTRGTTQYKKVKIANGTLQQIYADDVNLDNYQLLSSDGTESVILPMSKVEVKYDGEIPKCNLPYEHTELFKIQPSGTFGNQPQDHFSCAFLHLVDSEIEGNIYYDTTINNDELVDYGAYLVCGGKGDNMTEQMLLKMALSWAGSYGVFLTFKFFDHPTGDIIIKMHWLWAQNSKLSDLGNAERVLTTKVTFAASIDCGGYYYTGNAGSYWSTSVGQRNQLEIPLEDNGDIEFYIHDCPADGPLKIGLSLPYKSGRLNNCGIFDGELFSIDSFSIEPAGMRFDKYREPMNKSDVIENTTPSPYDASVNFPFTYWRANSHFICDSSNDPTPESGKPDMSHMFVTRHCVKPDLRMQLSNFHIDEYELDNKYYRIVGYSLDAINDKFTPTLLELEETS